MAELNSKQSRLHRKLLMSNKHPSSTSFNEGFLNCPIQKSSAPMQHLHDGKENIQHTRLIDMNIQSSRTPLRDISNGNFPPMSHPINLSCMSKNPLQAPTTTEHCSALTYPMNISSISSILSQSLITQTSRNFPPVSHPMNISCMSKNPLQAPTTTEHCSALTYPMNISSISSILSQSPMTTTSSNMNKKAKARSTFSLGDNSKENYSPTSYPMNLSSMNKKARPTSTDEIGHISKESCSPMSYPISLSCITDGLLESAEKTCVVAKNHRAKNCSRITLTNISNVCTGLNFTLDEAGTSTSRFVNENLQEDAVDRTTIIGAEEDYLDIGDPTWECPFCGALMWYQERASKPQDRQKPDFSLCCSQGKVQLPILKDPPELLKNLLNGCDSRSRHFLENIRGYNMMFSFTSMGGKIDSSIHNGQGPYAFRLHELCYDKVALQREHTTLLSSLTEEQRIIYETVMSAVQKEHGGIYFVYGHGGTGKTFIWRALSSAIRSKGEIVLTVASSGIASLLIPGGRTAHSRFRIPLNVNEDSTCNIQPGTPLAALLAKTKLIIWDEAPMVHKHCFEALDRSLRDVLRFCDSNSTIKPFGGKVVVFGGDFRQILPVIPKGSRQDIVAATLNSSYLWSSCKLLKLTTNMSLQTNSANNDLTELKEFSEWILKIGDGTVGTPNDGESVIEIPHDLLITYSTDPIAAIVNSTYPAFLDNLSDGDYFQERSILASTLDVVETMNEYMLSLVPGDGKIYLSSDSICKADGQSDLQSDVHTPEFLNTIRCSGIPTHKLVLKIGVPVMLLRNLDQGSGLCNGTRLMVTQLGNHVIEAKVISGNRKNDKVFIPRMVLTPADITLPFKFQRRQYPLAVCFAMTINKSQGQSLSNVGLYLPRPVFSHGQFYVAVSRVRSKSGLKILITDRKGEASDKTDNVVFKEVFHNLL